MMCCISADRFAALLSHFQLNEDTLLYSKTRARICCYMYFSAQFFQATRQRLSITILARR